MSFVNQAYFVVKSISLGFDSARSQVHDPAARAPQEQLLPATGAFSLVERSQVHLPEGRARQEHLAPLKLFSAGAFSQVQSSADFCPQEQVACLAEGQNGCQSITMSLEVCVPLNVQTYRKHIRLRSSCRSRWWWPLRLRLPSW